MDGFANSLIGTAGANISAHRIVDVRITGAGLLCQKRCRVHDLSWLAVTALRHIFFHPSPLHWMGGIRGEPFHRRALFSPTMLAAGVMHDRVASPLTCTVQAPHSAMPQPNFVPVMLSVSRRTHNKGMSGLTSTLWLFPFSVKLIAIVPSNNRNWILP